MSQLSMTDLALAQEGKGKLEYVPIDWITVEPGKPPSPQLIESIKAHGHILQPVMLNQREDGKYDCIFGRRRVLAAREVGLTEVPAIIHKIPEYAVRLLVAPVVENAIRQDNRPLAGQHVDALFDRGADEDAISGALGISKSKVRAMRRPWANLIPVLQTGWHTGAFKDTVAAAASKLGKDAQERLATLLAQHGTLTPRDVAREASGMEQRELPVDEAQTGWKPKARTHAMALELVVRSGAKTNTDAASFLGRLISLLDDYGLRPITFGNDELVKAEADWTDAERAFFGSSPALTTLARDFRGAIMDGKIAENLAGPIAALSYDRQRWLYWWFEHVEHTLSPESVARAAGADGEFEPCPWSYAEAHGWEWEVEGVDGLEPGQTAACPACGGAWIGSDHYLPEQIDAMATPDGEPTQEPPASPGAIKADAMNMIRPHALVDADDGYKTLPPPVVKPKRTRKKETDATPEPEPAAVG